MAATLVWNLGEYMTGTVNIRCRYRLPSPQSAGCGDDIDVETGEVRRTAADVLKEWAE